MLDRVWLRRACLRTTIWCCPTSDTKIASPFVMSLKPGYHLCHGGADPTFGFLFILDYYFIASSLNSVWGFFQPPFVGSFDYAFGEQGQCFFTNYFEQGTVVLLFCQFLPDQYQDGIVALPRVFINLPVTPSIIQAHAYSYEYITFIGQNIGSCVAITYSMPTFKNDLLAEAPLPIMVKPPEYLIFNQAMSSFPHSEEHTLAKK